MRNNTKVGEYENNGITFIASIDRKQMQVVDGKWKFI